jgi:hypothetical protein
MGREIESRRGLIWYLAMTIRRFKKLFRLCSEEIGRVDGL